MRNFFQKVSHAGFGAEPQAFFRSLKLRQEADVVLVEMTDVVDVVLQHGDTLHAHTEGKAAVHGGVDAAHLQHVGMHHARAQDLDPALVLAQTAALATADEAGDIYPS